MVSISKTAKRSGFVLPVTALLIDLIYAPNNADPLNPIKFWLLGFVALYCIGTLGAGRVLQFQGNDKRAVRAALLLIVIFLAFLSLAFLFTDMKSIGLIGFQGRQNGILSYFFLMLIFLYGVLKFKLDWLKNFYVVVIFANSIFTTYGFMQHFNIDPIKWSSPYNHIVLTVGNPDFAAALLGILAVLEFSLILSNISKLRKALIFLHVAITITVIYWSRALQGLVATALGIGILISVKLWLKYRKISIFVISSEIIIGISSIFGMLNVGPLSHYFYKASVRDRGYYWQAAWHMFTAHPWFGVGLDRYAGFFQTYQSPQYQLIYGASQTVNNAHNIFLEMLSTGGFFVGLAYFTLIALVFWRAFVALKIYSDSQQMLVTGIIAGWTIFVAQSVISVDNLCVSIWGWVLAGAVIGLSLRRNNDDAGVAKKYTQTRNIIKPKFIAVTTLWILFSLIVVPMYQGEMRLNTFQQIQPPSDSAGKDVYRKIAAETFDTSLFNSDYKVRVAFIMTNAGYLNDGINYFQKTLQSDPRRSDANEFLATIYESTKNIQLAIKYRLAAKKINPYGTDNLLSLQKDFITMNDRLEAKKVSDLIIELVPDTDVATESAKIMSKY